MLHDVAKTVTAPPSTSTPARLLRATAATVMLIAGPTLAQVESEAVQWRVDDGGNGHWYAHTVVPYPVGTDLCGMDWAVDHAEAIGAHPATITSAAEETVVLEVLPYFNGTYSTAFLGGRRDTPTSEWYWVTGEPFEYSNFIGGVSVGQNIHLYDEESIYGPGWRRGYDCFVVEDVTVDEGVSVILEWSADCNDDGIVDYGQILDGIFIDLDQNGVPDCCDGGSFCRPPCPADLSGDGIVDPIDLGLLLTLWGTDGQNNPQADIDGDGLVGPLDLGLVLSGWGVCPEG